MTRKVEPGYYEVGQIKQKRGGPRPRQCGMFGVIRGDVAEENGHLEWSHICEGALKTSKWFTFRVGPGDNGKGTRTDLLKACDTKQDAIDHLQRRCGNKFDEEY